MKNIITAIIIFSTFNIYAQSGSIKVHAKSNCSQSNNSVFVVDIFVQAENIAEDVYLAEQNYRFSFNELALANPALLTTGSDITPGIPSIENGNIQFYYDSATSNGTKNNKVSISIDLLNDTGINLSNSTQTYICSVQFDVQNASLPINFNWHDANEFPPTYLLSNNIGVGRVVAPGIFYDNLKPTVQDHFNSVVSATDFNRDRMHVCNTNDGSLTINWSSNLYNDIYVSIDGGRTFSSAPNGTFFADNLSEGDYDIRVKEGENGCPVTLDDINIRDLSHEIAHNSGHPTCGESDGWIELTWVKKALNNIDVSIDGGQTYTRIPAADEFYRIDGLPTGDYDIWVKWDYALFACPTKLDDISLGVASPANSGIDIDYSCINDELILSQTDIGAERYQLRYRTFQAGWAPKWINTKQIIAPNSQQQTVTHTIVIPNLRKVKVMFRVMCDGKWSSWSLQRHFNLPACKLANDIDEALINVYPNPANQRVKVDITENIAEGSILSIYDMFGKRIQKSVLAVDQKSIQFNVKNLANGIYMIELNTSDDKIHTQKLTITH